jgi:hypothetical protein
MASTPDSLISSLCHTQPMPETTDNILTSTLALVYLITRYHLTLHPSHSSATPPPLPLYRARRPVHARSFTSVFPLLFITALLLATPTAADSMFRFAYSHSIVIRSLSRTRSRIRPLRSSFRTSPHILLRSLKQCTIPVTSSLSQKARTPRAP